MGDLQLALNGVYFDQIAAGTKWEEYRLVTPYWTKILAQAPFAGINIYDGYPPRGDHSRTLNNRASASVFILQVPS